MKIDKFFLILIYLIIYLEEPEGSRKIITQMFSIYLPIKHKLDIAIIKDNYQITNFNLRNNIVFFDKNYV